MITRTEEILRQLNRLANDRQLAPNVRNKILETVQHIRELQGTLMELTVDQIETDFVD